MTSSALPAAGDDGYWTIQMICSDRNQIGRRYVCRATDDAGARFIAGRLEGATVVGYDYHRVDNPVGLHARGLQTGQVEAVNDPDLWAALGSARRSA